VEVDRTALLELGDLPERDPRLFLAGRLRQSGAGGDLTAEVDGEALP
jgi:hypothetical protein